MKKIFGDAGKVKALFDEINKLSGIDVSTTGSKVKLYANTGSLAGLKIVMEIQGMMLMI